MEHESTNTSWWEKHYRGLRQKKILQRRKGIPLKQWKGLSWRPFSLWLVLPLLLGTIAVLLFSFVGGVFHDAKSHMRRQGNNTWNNDKACYRAWCVIHFPSPKKLSVFFYKYFSPITSQIKELVFFKLLDWYKFTQYVPCVIAFPTSQSNDGI